MCYVIITCRSITWTLLTLASTAVIIMAVISPHWLTGPAEWTGQANSLMDNNETIEQVSYRATIGLFNRCTRLERLLESDEDDGGHGEESCTIYVTGFDMSSEEFPDAWKSALILFALAVTLLAFTSFTAVFSLCVQAIFKKSIFTVSGLIQSLAALFVVIGQVLYPAGWSARRVKDLCGDKAGPFLIDGCHIGWAYYACMVGTVLLFLCALLSIQAETSTSSDKVERRVTEGKQLICVV